MDGDGETSPGGPGSASQPDGIIGWVEGRAEGPLLLCVGGLHGNEPAGVRALERVVERVRDRRSVLTGDFVAVAGNLHALSAGRRFMAYDLNRAWTPSRISAQRNGAVSLNGRVPAPEDVEMARMLDILDAVSARRRGPVYVLDIHTTSGGGGAFTTTADSPRHKDFAMAIPAPLVMRLDEHLEGTLTSHLDRLGYTAAVFECGQHEEAESRVRATSAIWLAIRAAGLIADAHLPEAQEGYTALEEAYRRLPRILEMKYRHPVTEVDRYRTRPGFRNFQWVRVGDVIGDDRHGEVVTPRNGRILMPLYQEQGEDGFFVVRDVEARVAPVAAHGGGSAAGALGANG